ncbi:anaphase-promoting complex, cyclosome, subunit 4-domain-containing protein [Thelonectria olida]|uniref:Anaphase-promoting complex subunit 4 n=1 Tax=Thelonectria olida TaxID=1576542 RepID=A0A9P8W7Z8_9HYPO|nr:anaphase-promoting complex, cyclosome, subunit 4-domain-containing protein [Thelonectria olida]
MAKKNPPLTLFSEIEYEEKVPKGYPASCPTLDLSATWDAAGKNLLIYRPPSQAVSKIHQVAAPGKKAPDAQAVTWKPDGQFLAVGWSDGFVRLMGLETNKAAHHIRVCGAPDVKITHIGWAISSIVDESLNVASKAIRIGLAKDEAALGLDGEDAIDLPQELASLEVDTSLPKISPLPSSSAGAGEDAMVFTLRTGIDFLFQPPKPSDYDQVTVMIIGTSDSKLQLSIYDSFIIGSFPCPELSSSGTSQLIYHASHPKVSTHALLLADKSEEPEEVHLVPMDLPFISSSPINLSLLASKLTTLQNLLRYLKQAQLHMQAEWKNTRELPTRFLRSVEGDLENAEAGPRGIVPALYHTVVTGHAYPPVREWLVDSLAERGHKRWDKAVVSGLENLRNLVHEHFLPALDRCSIILSRLKGLAQFYDDRDDIGFTVAQINRVTDIISCLSLIGHKVLIIVMDELDHFSSFSTWLRFEIDRLASSTSSMREELDEKEATIDHGKVLTYIETYLVESPLKIFFDETSKEDHDTDLAHIGDGPNLLDELDTQIKKFENGQPHMKALPHVDFLVDYMTTWSSRIFEGIAEAKKRSVRFGNPIKLYVGHPIRKMDVRMCKTKSNEMKMVTALTSNETKNRVTIFHAGIDIINGISSNFPPTSCCIDLGSRDLIDFKFLNDESLIVLCTQDNVPSVLRIPIQRDRLPYGDYDPSNPTETTHVVSANPFEIYSFPETPVLRPIRMDVHDKSNVRGEVPARVCLLESNCTTLRTYALPSAAA